MPVAEARDTVPTKLASSSSSSDNEEEKGKSPPKQKGLSEKELEQKTEEFNVSSAYMTRLNLDTKQPSE